MFTVLARTRAERSASNIDLQHFDEQTRFRFWMPALLRDANLRADSCPSISATYMTKKPC